jgi:hypothetical protein
MTEAEIQDFVVRFAAAWAARDGTAFRALWHDTGVMIAPWYGRDVSGEEWDRVNDALKEQAPDLVWQLLDWSCRGDVIMIEWQNTRMLNGTRVEWRGIDKFRLKDGKIIEERVYCDTAPLRALNRGDVLEPLVNLR